MGVNLSHHDVNWVYNCQYLKDTRYYLKTLESVVWDKCMGNPKFGNNIISHKLFCIKISNIGQRLSLNLLCEVICAYEEPSLISYRLWEWPHNVHAPLCKRQWTRERIQHAPRLMDAWGKPLALIALPNTILSFFLHTWPLITLSKSPMW